MARMQIILKELCWEFGKRARKFQRRFRIANRSGAFLALLYSGLAFFPQPLFAPQLFLRELHDPLQRTPRTEIGTGPQTC